MTCIDEWGIAERPGVILADPPWAFDTYSPRGQNRNPSRHYPTMPTRAMRADRPGG
jgi:hypothetical protein